MLGAVTWVFSRARHARPSFPKPVMPSCPISPQILFQVKLHHGRRHGCRCNRWLVHCNMAGFMAMLISVGIHNPRRNPTWRWTSVFAMIAVAQPTKNGYEVSPKWIYGKKVPHGDFLGLSSTNVPIGKEKNVVHCYKEIPSSRQEWLKSNRRNRKQHSQIQTMA